MIKTHAPDRREVLVAGLALAAATSAKAADDFKMFDGHMHLISDDVKKYPPATGPSSPGADPPGSPPGPGASLQVGKPHMKPDAGRALQWMDQEGIGQIAAVQRRGSYGFDNRYILDSSDAHPTRFRPVVVLDGEDPATPAQLLDWVKTHRICGLRITGPADPHGWLDSDQAFKTWAAADDLGLTMNVLYAPQRFNAECLRAILGVARKFPRVKLVVDHFGWPTLEAPPISGFAHAPEGFTSQPNIYFKYSTTNLYILQEAKIPTAVFMRDAVNRIGAQRIFWGSDVGSAGGTYGEMVQMAKDSAASLTEAERRQVLGDTGRGVFAPARGAA
jgi:predicted TIM-barrel fold metal-dependent hydrolase